MDIKEILEYPLIEQEGYSLTLYNIIGVLVIAIVIFVFLRIIKNLLMRRSKKRSIDSGRLNSIFLIIKYIVWVVGITLILETLGVKITIIIAGSTALFVGLGLGLQAIFNDLVSGLFLLFEGTIEVDDIIEVDGLIGRVKQIKLRTSKVVTRDDVVLIVPNHKFITENVINWSHMNDKSRFQVSVGVAYGSDTKKVAQLLKEAVVDHPKIEADPAPIVRFENFGESSLDFIVFFWSKEIFYIEMIRSNIRFNIDQKFRENGISIPFPQRDVHIKKDL